MSMVARDTRATGRRTLRDVVREQGRYYQWLAHQTGYTEQHVGAVARGTFVGSVAFHLAMERALGTTYDWPKKLKRPEGV